MNFKLFESKQVGLLYHFTNLISLYWILHEDYLFTIRYVGDFDNLLNSYNLQNKSEWFYISFTRDKNFLKTSSNDLDHPINCRITIDGNKLSHHHKIYPINYFSNSNTTDESEECIIVKDELKNLSIYTLKVEIPTLENFKLEVNSDDDEYRYKLEGISEHFGLNDEYENKDIDKKHLNLFAKKLYQKIIDRIDYDNTL